MTNEKIKLTIYITKEAKAILDALYISHFKDGNKKSYGEIVDDALKDANKDLRGGAGSM